MAKKINRRTFIWSSVISGISLIIGSWWIFNSTISIQNIIAGLVCKKLDYLQIDDKGLSLFANEIMQQGFSFSIRFRIIFPFYINTNLFNSHRMDRIAEQLAEKFLMSCDFFWTGFNEERVVQFTGLYDRITMPCRNPFAILDD